MGLELAKAYVRIRADDSQLPQDLENSKGKIGKSVGSMGGMFAAAAGGLIAVGAGLLARRGLGLAADLEQTGVAFETMLGSASKAETTLNDLQKFAASTPFNLPGIQQAAKTLLAFQVTQEELLPTMRALGDVSAGTGKDLSELAVIYGQIKSKGKLQGGELLQLAEAGVPIIAVLAEQMGVAQNEIADMASKGQIGFKDVEKAMQSMSAEGGAFANLMDKQSGTVGGLVSTIGDTFDAMLTQIFTALQPVTKAFLNMTLGMLEYAGQAFDGISGKLVEWGTTVADWLVVLSQNFSTFWELYQATAGFALSRVLDIFSNIWQNLPEIAWGSLMVMKTGFFAWITYIGQTLMRLVDLFKSVFGIVQDMWLNIFTGKGIGESMKQAMSQMGSVMKEALVDQAMDAGGMVDKVKNEFKDQFAGLDLMQMGENSRLLEQDIGRAADTLMNAKLKLEQERKAAEEEAASEVANKEEAAAKEDKKNEAKSGFAGFADLAKKIQEDALKQGDKNQQRLIRLSERNNELQENILRAVEKNAGGAMALTGGN